MITFWLPALFKCERSEIERSSRVSSDGSPDDEQTARKPNGAAERKIGALPSKYHTTPKRMIMKKLLNGSYLKRIALACALMWSAGSANADYTTTLSGLNPLGYWRLNEPTQPVVPTYPLTNSGALGAGANGTYYGVPKLGQPGALSTDTAANFNGTGQYAEVPYNAALNPTGPFTVEFWANLTNASAGAKSGVVSRYITVPGGPTGQFGYLFFVNNGNTKWQFRVYNGTAGVTVTDTFGPDIQADTWYHVVGVYDGAEISIYVNGVQSSPAVAGAYVANTNTPLRIGAGTTEAAPTLFFPGLIDEVAVYPTALSAAQIAANYAAASATPAGYAAQIQGLNPAAYWRMNEPALPPYIPYAATNSGSLGSAQNGTYVGGASSGAIGPVKAQFAGFETDNKSAAFSAVNSHISIPGFATTTDTATIVGWIKRDGNQVNASPILLQRADGSPATGLVVDFNNRLGYVWNDDPATYSYNPGADFFLPDGVWTFAALSVSPTEATIYIGSTNGLRSATRTGAHSPHDFSGGPLQIGRDGTSGTRMVKGNLDEVALFGAALDATTISNLFYSATPAIPLVLRTPADPVYEGMTVHLTAYGIASGPVNYQWRKNGANVGANSPTLTLNNVSTGDSGSYDVVVTYGANSVTGAVSVINVVAGPPVIFAQPEGGTRLAGGKITLSVSAGGSVPLSYQWQKGTTDIPGATTASYTITGITPADAGDYRAVIVNPYGTNITTVASLAVLPAANYAAVVMAGQPDAYWRLNETSGGIAFDYAAGLNGTNSASVVNGVDGPRPPSRPGFEAGNVARQLNGTDGWITAAPLNWNTDTVTFTAWVNLAGYDDDLSGVVFARGNSASGLDIRSTGELRYHWADGQWGFASGIFVPLNTWTFLALVVEPGRGTLYMNDGSGLVSAVNTTPHGVTALSDPLYLGRDRTDRPLVGNIDEVAIYKRALAPDEIANLSLMGITGPTPPAIVSQPASQTVIAGQPASLTVGTIGAAPMTYQWKLNGVNIPGATTKTLALAEVHYSDAGSYTVGITNAQGFTNSQAATLTVLAPPTFANLTNDLVLHLKFDDNAQDSSGRGNNGAIMGTPSFVPGKVGSALRYNTVIETGTYNYVAVVPATTDLQFGYDTSFSVAYWVKFTGLPGDLPFLCTSAGSYGAFGLTFAPSYNLGGWSYYLGSDATSVGLYGPANSINDGTWHSLVHTFDRTGNAVTYLNGVAVDTRSIAAVGNMDTGSPFTIGQDATGSYQENGQADIDDLGIWRRVLSPLEVTALYAAGAQGRSFDTYGPVSLTIEKVGGELELIWEAGTLESADSVGGPYAPVVGASAPYYKVTVGTGNKFYRVKL